MVAIGTAVPVEAPPGDTELDAVAYVMAARVPRSRHGQLCPLWTGRHARPPTTLDRCDCWIVSNARVDAAAALGALDRRKTSGGICGHAAPTIVKDGSPAVMCDLPAGHEWHGAPNAGSDTRMTWTCRPGRYEART